MKYHYKILSILAIFGLLGMSAGAMEEREGNNNGKRTRETTPENQGILDKEQPAAPKKLRINREDENVDLNVFHFNFQAVGHRPAPRNLMHYFNAVDVNLDDQRIETTQVVD